MGGRVLDTWLVAFSFPTADLSLISMGFSLARAVADCCKCSLWKLLATLNFYLWFPILVKAAKLCFTFKPTWFCKEVNEWICLAALVKLWQLRAAVQTEVVDAETALTADGGVQQGALGSSDNIRLWTIMHFFSSSNKHNKTPHTWTKAPVSSLRVSSCLNSTVTALSQSTAAISMSVVLLM